METWTEMITTTAKPPPTLDIDRLVKARMRSTLLIEVAACHASQISLDAALEDGHEDRDRGDERKHGLDRVLDSPVLKGQPRQEKHSRSKGSD